MSALTELDSYSPLTSPSLAARCAAVGVTVSLWNRGQASDAVSVLCGLLPLDVEDATRELHALAAHRSSTNHAEHVLALLGSAPEGTA